MKNLFVNTILSFIFLFSTVNSQTHKPSSETDSFIPELNEYHDVIYQIWHTAYPDKDFAMLKKMMTDVNSGAEKIYSVTLPGILRDKSELWNMGVMELRSSVEKYTKAMNTEDETEMLKAAEKLHSDYEMLVRIIKPLTHEIDEFHKVLYMIYHHYWPNRDTEKFENAVNDLEMRAKELNTCVLPKWAANKSDEFKKQSKRLYESTVELKNISNTEANESSIDKAVEEVHNTYVAIERLFD